MTLETAIKFIQDYSALITVAVTVLGLGLSTYKVISAKRDRANKLKVSLKLAIAAVGPEPETIFRLEAIHPRGRPVTVTGCGIVFPNGNSFIVPRPIGSVQLPHELKEGNHCVFLYSLRDVVRALQQEGFTGRIKLRAEFQDALGNDYRSKPFRGDVTKLAKIAGRRLTQTPDADPARV